MDCPDCKGTGGSTSPSGTVKPCWRCDGSGELCDACGESVAVCKGDCRDEDED